MSVESAFDLPMSGPTLLRAVAEGDVDIAELHCGVLTEVDSVFQLGSLPFQSSTPSAAVQLLAAARSRYQQALEHLGVHLLYVSPWPPTGLWTRAPVGGIAGWSKVRVRTYDKMSADVLAGLGAHARSMPFDEACQALQDARLDGVLSSGDCRVGQRLSKYLGCYYDFRYATPISSGVIHRGLYRSLPKPSRQAMDQASSTVERCLWAELPVRMLRNREWMRSAGIQMMDIMEPEVRKALLESARIAVDRWEHSVPVATASILSAYYPSPQGR